MRNRKKRSLTNYSGCVLWMIITGEGSVSPLLAVSKMEVFTIPEDTTYVCIGPTTTATRAAAQLEAGDQPNPWWENFPSTHQSGTVLVHDVDFRIPAHSGRWFAGKLYDFNNIECGAMVQHENVGDVAGACSLLREMENTGAPVICNQESDQIRELGIRFIGRYSWESSKFSSDHSQDSDWFLCNGPSCFFSTPTAIREKFLPEGFYV